LSYLLNIETSTTVCSVSISKNGGLLFFREEDNGYSHAENLHQFIDSVLKEGSVKPFELSAVAVSKGPGSYTGLRIGVSAAKGLCYALSIPLIGIDTLQILTEAVSYKESDTVYCPMLDARRMEVYTNIYSHQSHALGTVEALIVTEDSVKKYGSYKKTCFFGNGMPKCRTLLSSPNSFFVENIQPSARHMVNLAYGKFIEGEFESVAYFEPFYLKDFFIK
jgi:tRNA threonylcarbamoyladenosine biosynthesis protein TsaB